MAAVPDAFRWIGYWALGRLFNRPRTLVALVRLAQRLGAAVACSDAEVDAVFRRTSDFSSRAHADNLVAGEFVIGLDSGPLHAREREAARCPLPTPVEFGDLAASEAQKRVALLASRLDAGESFDLVNDYMVFVAWRALSGIFGCAAARAVEGMVPGGDRETSLHALFHELRHVGAHLIVGGLAPRRIQLRAHACADALNQRVAGALDTIRADWSTRAPAAVATAQRQAVGLMWVGHPAMAQAGVFVFQELRAQPAHYAALRESVSALGDAAYGDEPLRGRVLGHVMECLRLRPPFPLLSRLLPREADLELGARHRPKTLAAGTSVTLAVGAALRDPGKFDRPNEYWPMRLPLPWPQTADALQIFGVATRACIAREQVVELLVSAVIGLLSMPELEYADGAWRRLLYDGPIVTRLRLRKRT